MQFALLDQSIKIRNPNIEFRNKYEFSNNQNSKPFRTFEFIILKLFRISDLVLRILDSRYSKIIRGRKSKLTSNHREV